MGITVDVDKLRDYLTDDAGSAAFSGFPFAMADVVAIDSMSPERLCAYAQDRGVDLHRFAAEEWDDVPDENDSPDEAWR